MKNIGVYLFLLLSSFIFSCEGNEQTQTTEEQPPVNLMEALPGTWTSHSFVVNINTEDGGEINRVMKVTPENYEEAVRYKPSKFIIKEDHTYEEIFRNLEDSVFYQSFGHWDAANDSLYLFQQLPTEGYFGYAVQVSPDSMTQKTWVDWDADGSKDDSFEGVFYR